MAIKQFHRDQPDHYMPLISNDARLVVWPGVGSEMANMNYVVLEPGEENVPHAHSESEDTIFILEGRGSVADLDNDIVHEFEAGDAVHVPTGVKHAVRADRDSRIVSVGGPCPPDRYLLKLSGAL
ncbi:cupin domain-containing protein [Candidatus Poriferisocius sp.]|uniref:cupin domain-containing protein n=1 Tax=Candidatus Poriferisocius sp. TaxID=3101276 RepID=UPI003B01BABA